MKEYSGVIKTRTFIDQFVERNIERLNRAKKELSLKDLQMTTEKYPVNRPSFADALLAKKRRGKLALIAEIKKRSPTAGELSQARDVISQARRYEYSGASAVLLIAKILEKSLLKDLIIIAHEIGSDVLVEVHDEREVEKALGSGAKIIGVNARDLRTMRIDLDTFRRVIPRIPEDVIRVAESGVETKEHVALAKEAGADAILVGTSLMRSKNPKQLIHEFLNVS